jgi:hypothetical protein
MLGGTAICEDGHVFRREEVLRLALCIGPANVMSLGRHKGSARKTFFRGVQDLTVNYRRPGGHQFNVCDPGG